MADTNTEKLVSPYIPWETLIEAIAHLKATAVPGRIDKSAIPSNMAPLVKGQVQSALKFLGLIDHDSKTKDALRSLVEVYETDEWAAKLKELIPKRYVRIVGDLELMDATQHLLDEKFAAAGIKGQMALKSIRFYLAALSAAGIPYSPHLAQRRKSATQKKTPGNRPRGRKKKKVTGLETASSGSATHTGDDDVPAGMVAFPMGDGRQALVPQDINTADCGMLNAMFMAYAERHEDGGG